MMVSKIAVMALVAVISVPILLGYAMNLNEVTVTEYKDNNDPMNVTQLLQTGTDWSIAYGDPYVMNTNPGDVLYENFPAQPIYNRISSVNTSIPVYSGDIVAGTGSQGGMQQFSWYTLRFDYVISASNYVSIRFYDTNNTFLTQIDGITYIHYEGGKLSYFGYYNSNPDTQAEMGGTLNYPNLGTIQTVFTGMATCREMYSYALKTGNVSFADIAYGYYFEKFSGKPRIDGWDLTLPENTISALLTVNLDSITASDYTLIVEDHSAYTPLRLIKTTVGGVVHWQVYKSATNNFELYYDPNISDNTYQILFTDLGTVGSHTEGNAQFRYVGHWPKTIGEANYYQTYDIRYSNYSGNTLDSINLRANDGTTSRTPTVRIDAAQFRAYEYPVVEGSIDPAAFKMNPATSITNIEQYGSQIIFGGNTYDVTDGNITIGTHQIPVRNMVLDSVPNADTLQYDNRINGTVVSTTADPSTIQFVGKWSANIAIESMSPISYVRTEWVAGSFGWDGLDHNFLIVGLLASLGAFIALGIYARRARASIWPLLIVCGGAAILFFIML